MNREKLISDFRTFIYFTPDIILEALSMDDTMDLFKHQYQEYAEFDSCELYEEIMR